MRLTDKNKIKELETLQKHNVLMTDADYKELKLGQLEDILEKYNIDTNDELEVLCKYVEDVKHWKSIHEEKMLEIKRIEEELGIDLTILFKAFEEDIWIKFDNKIMFVPYDKKVFVFYEGNIHCYPLNEQYGYTVSIDDYGTTWTLTKKELENDK